MDLQQTVIRSIAVIVETVTSAKRVGALVAAMVLVACVLGVAIGVAAAYGERSDKCGEIGYAQVDIWLEHRLWKQDAEFWALMGQRGFTKGEALQCNLEHRRDLLWNGAWPRWYEHWDEGG